jgi:hypothetical protein
MGVPEQDAEVHLVESDEKKAAFLREAARVAEAPVTLHVQRIESLAPFPVDAVTARACAPLPRLLYYAAPFLGNYRSGAVAPLGLFLKGRDIDRELTKVPEKWKMPRLLDYAAPFLGNYRSGAMAPLGLFLKGRDIDRELTKVPEKWKMRVDLISSRTDPAARIVRIKLPNLGDNQS